MVMAQNRDATSYEYMFYARALMICSNFMLRHQGGSEVKDVQTYFRETYDQSSSEFVFKTVAQTAFFNLLSSLANVGANNPNSLVDIIEVSHHCGVVVVYVHLAVQQ